MTTNISEVISEINNLFDTKFCNQGYSFGPYHTAQSLFMTGACWYYAYMLKKLYPEGQIMISTKKGHVVFKMEGKCYDACGRYLIIDEKDFFVDEEVVCSPGFDRPDDKELIEIIDLIVSEIKSKNATIYTGVIVKPSIKM